MKPKNYTAPCRVHQSSKLKVYKHSLGAGDTSIVYRQGHLEIEIMPGSEAETYISIFPSDPGLPMWGYTIVTYAKLSTLTCLAICARFGAHSLVELKLQADELFKLVKQVSLDKDVHCHPEYRTLLTEETYDGWK